MLRRALAVAILGLVAACPSSRRSPVTAADTGHPDGGEPPLADAAPGDMDAAPGEVDGGRADLGVDGGFEQPGDCALPLPADDGASYTSTIHVAEDGDDDASGQQDAPLATLRAAAAQATPGTRILLAAGTYRGRTDIVNLQGEPGRPIAVAGVGEVVLDADGASEVLHLTDARYVVLEDLIVQGARVNGINIDDGRGYETPSEHVVLRRITVRNIGSGGNNDCVKLSGVDRFHVLDSDISGCNMGSAIDMVGCHDGVISGNHFHDTPGGGIQAKGGSARTIIHGNRFVDVRRRSVNAGGSTGLEFFRPIDAPYEAADLSIVSNVFVRSGEDSGAPVAFVGCDGCRFSNNTVIEPVTWLARILQESTGPRFVPSRNGRFVNNLIVLRVDDLRTFVNVGPDTAPETFVFDHNLWWALDRDETWPGPTYPPGVPAATMSVIQRDPNLRDLAGGGYELTSDSPAIGAGLPLAEPHPDFAGRCYGADPSIGAFAAP